MGFIKSFIDAVLYPIKLVNQLIIQPFARLFGFTGADTQNLAPQELDSSSIATIEQGKNPPIVWGTRLVNQPNVVWFGDVRSTPIYTSGAGKK